MKPMLASPWDGKEPAGWLMAEKLDGLRAIWTGRELLSREGHAFRPPAWWTVGLPDMALDGELYGGPGTLSKLAGMFHRIEPIDAEWQSVKFHVFDAPEAAGGILEREVVYTRALNQNAVAVALRHLICRGLGHLREFCGGIIADGGEGVVLRHPSAGYKPGRSANVLKIRPVEYVGHAQLIAGLG